MEARRVDGRMDVPRRAFFSRREGQGRPLGTVSFHLGDVSPDRQTDRRGRCTAAPSTQPREGSEEEEGCGWQLARKAHARLVLVPGLHVAHICTAAEAMQARSRLGDRALGDEISGR